MKLLLLIIYHKNLVKSLVRAILRYYEYVWVRIVYRGWAQDKGLVGGYGPTKLNNNNNATQQGTACHIIKREYKNYG